MSTPRKQSTDTKTLRIKVTDRVSVRDKNDTQKSWFNGLKHFFTIKVLPPRR